MVTSEMAWLSIAIYPGLHIVYGTSFLLMALGIFIFRRKAGDAEPIKNFTLLAAFAILRGLAEYANIPRYLNLAPLWPFDILKLAIVSASYAALLGFGFRILTTGSTKLWWSRGLPVGALVMYYWVLLFAGLDLFNTGRGVSYEVAYYAQQQSLGFAGAMVSGYAFYHLYSKMEMTIGGLANRYLLMGFSFWLYGISAGLLRGDEFLGFPLIVLNTILAVLIALGMRALFFDIYAVPGK